MDKNPGSHSGEETSAAGIDFAAMPAGHVDQAELSSGEIRISGWMLQPEYPLTELQIHLDGVLLGDAVPQSRPDVERVHRWVRHAARSGFAFHRNGEIQGHLGLRELEIRGFGRSGESASMATLIDDGSASSRPVPPADLFRLVGSPDAASYVSQGRKVFADITSAIRRYEDPVGFTRILDWGCGCGRLMPHLTSSFPHASLTGCDLVPEAIGWCRRQFPNARFKCTGARPPTPFADASFDLVIASSVFTHLDRRLQGRWLEELARVLEPGGFLVASVLGEYAYLRDLCSGWNGRNPLKFFLLRRRLKSHGILDQFKNNSLHDLVDPDYYRNTYQEPGYTSRAWSKYFRLRTYIERGLDNYQDLLVMKRDE